jgi:putative FmdB family regulatory protein
MPLYDFRCGEGHRFERMVSLAHFSEAQACDCGSAARRVLSAPRVLSDHIEPIMGADGRMHTSLSSYRRSLAPSGNPKGERFIELGNESLPEYQPPKTDKAALVDAVRAGMADVKAGRVPPVATGDLP